MKTINLGTGFYIPSERIIHIFPSEGNMAKKIVASVKASNTDGSRIYDCTGRRKKASVVVVQGGPAGDHLVLSPLTSKTIAKKLEEIQ